VWNRDAASRYPPLWLRHSSKENSSENSTGLSHYHGRRASAGCRALQEVRWEQRVRALRRCAKSQYRCGKGKPHDSTTRCLAFTVSGRSFYWPNRVYQQGAKDLIFRAVEDADLIRQAAEGAVEAYNLLVSQWEKRVYNYLLRLTRHREDAMDLTQDVFLKAYQNLRKLNDPARFAPWLYRIAHNEAYSMFRKRKPEMNVGEIEPESTETGIIVGGSSLFPVELSLAVASAMERLSAHQREAVVLKIYRGFRFDEMAGILSCSVSTAKSRLYTALESLKADLASAPPQNRRILNGAWPCFPHRITSLSDPPKNF
jgi:RNA polymerase sigma-70 factor (ECF subfamily)